MSVMFSTFWNIPHEIYPITYGEFDDVQMIRCKPCSWTRLIFNDDWLTAFRAAISHSNQPVPAYRTVLGIVECNLCNFSSGNTGLDKTLEQVIADHFTKSHGALIVEEVD